MVATDLTIYPLIRWVEDTTMAVSVKWLATAGSVKVNLSMEIETIAELAVVRLLLHSHTYYILVANETQLVHG